MLSGEADARGLLPGPQAPCPMASDVSDCHVHACGDVPAETHQRRVVRRRDVLNLRQAGGVGGGHLSALAAEWLRRPPGGELRGSEKYGIILVLGKGSR